MNDEIRGLLGGYAAGNLTREEKELLYQAALEDPALFEALADEQALKELMDDPAARAEMLAAVEQPRPFTILGALTDWFARPKAKALVALGAVAIVAIAIREYPRQKAPEPFQIAVLQPRPEPQPIREAPQAAREVPATAPPVQTARAKEQSQPGAAAPPPAAPPSAAPEAQAIIVATPPPAAAPVVAPPPSSQQQVMVAVAPPPPPPPKVAREKAADALLDLTAMPQVSYSLLRRDAAGVFQPVPNDYEFSATDRIRIQLQSDSQARINVRRADAVVFSGTLAPGTRFTLPGDLAAEGADVRVEMASPLPEANAFAPSAGLARRTAVSQSGGPAPLVIKFRRKP